jgi:hypothetical protein
VQKYAIAETIASYPKPIMQKALFLVSFFLIPIISFGQHYKSADLIKKADSIIKTTVSERIFTSHFHYDTDSYYEYKNFWGKKKWKILTKNRCTKGKFKNMQMRYLFCLDKYNATCQLTWIEFDSALNKIGPLETGFIPEYILENKECNFISDTMALQIAKNTFNKKEIRKNSIGLSYDYKRKMYVWRIDNILTENTNSFGEKYGKIQLVEIDALTGKILSYYPDAIYGPLH